MGLEGKTEPIVDKAIGFFVSHEEDWGNASLFMLTGLLFISGVLYFCSKR